MRKADSLHQLRKWGFNVLPFVEVQAQAPGDMLRLLTESLGSLPWSIRSEMPSQEDGGNFPFYYGEQEPDRVVGICCTLLSGGYKVLASKTLDTTGCLACGALAIPHDGEPYVEYGTGPHTIREVFAKGGLTKMVVSDRIHTAIEEDIVDHIFGRAFNLLPAGTTSKILEWSLYRQPVGELHKRDIWWEVRPYK